MHDGKDPRFVHELTLMVHLEFGHKSRDYMTCGRASVIADRTTVPICWSQSRLQSCQDPTKGVLSFNVVGKAYVATRSISLKCLSFVSRQQFICCHRIACRRRVARCHHIHHTSPTEDDVCRTSASCKDAQLAMWDKEVIVEDSSSNGLSLYQSPALL